MVDTTGILFTGGVGTGCWAAAGWEARRQWQARSGRRVTGLVTQVNAAARGDSSVVRFVDETGVPHRIDVNVSGTVGQEVCLGYPVGLPQQARRVGGVGPWGFSIMATVVGGVFLTVAASLLTGGLPAVLMRR